MLQYLSSDLFSSPARVVVNTVNTVGVMGKGIALEFKQRFPDMYERYRDLCTAGQIDVGKLWLWRARDQWILNFPTKKHWRNPSRPEYIEAGLEKFVLTYASLGIDSISFPLLGCGNGGLNFESQVRPLMERYLKPLSITVYVHVRTEGPGFVPEHKEMDLFSMMGHPPTRFHDFWCDVRRVAERNAELHLRTLATGSPFRVALATDDNLVFLRSGGTKVHIPKEDLYDLWIRLRMTGSISASHAPGRIGREYGLVFSLLSLLPYIQPVKIGDDFEAVTTRPSIGIQLQRTAGTGTSHSRAKAVVAS